jgi:parvulin-like peptidyl-prolyl isomerase
MVRLRPGFLMPRFVVLPVVRMVVLMVAAAAQAGLGAAVSAGEDDGGFPADVIVTVGDTPILRGDLQRVLRRVGAAAEAAEPAKRQQLEAAALEQLIDERLLRGEIARAQIPVTDAEIDAGVGRLREQMAARGQDWDAFLVRAGFDEQAIRGQVALEVGLDKFVRSQLREDRLAAAFARHRRKVDGTQLRVSHILLRPDIARGEEAVTEAMERAAAIRSEVLQASLSFAEAAQRHSAGPSRERGGDLGWITRQAPMVEEFSRQAYELAKGDISRPFVTPFGVHLLQVTDAAPGQRGPDEVRKDLLSLLAADVVRETVAQARAATPITYAEGVVHFDPATPADGRVPRRIIVAGGVVAEGADR